MLNRLKGVVANSRKNENSEGKPPVPKTEKFVYSRPYFLGLNKDEVENSRDFGLRPIFIPRNKDKTHTLPFLSGYAEIGQEWNKLFQAVKFTCINGGKSNYNEDNSYACTLRICHKQGNGLNPNTVQQYSSPVWPDNTGGHITRKNSQSEQDCCFEAEYFGVFDGHAGYHVSVIASRLLHQHLKVKLESCLEFLLPNELLPADCRKQVTIDHIVIGALEEAFAEMDDQLEREGSQYKIKGGCTALVALFLFNKLYVANAGDCRAVLCHGKTVTQLSTDFNPESERQRINYIGHCHPELLYNEFSCIEFIRRLNKNDLGKRVLCRKPYMEGWTTKCVTEEDLKFPLVTGEGRKARLMGTIGVTRGLGDHDLYVYDTDISIKPFLSSKPEVTVVDLSDKEWTDQDVLILGSDGLWDGITQEEAYQLVHNAIQPQNNEDNSVTRYTIAAQDLVCEAKGVFTGRGWRKRTDAQASFDDITAFVIPIKPAVNTSGETDERSEHRSEARQNVQLSDGQKVETLENNENIEQIGDHNVDTGDDKTDQNELKVKREKRNPEEETEENVIKQEKTEQVTIEYGTTQHTSSEQELEEQENTIHDDTDIANAAQSLLEKEENQLDGESEIKKGESAKEEINGNTENNIVPEFADTGVDIKSMQ